MPPTTFSASTSPDIRPGRQIDLRDVAGDDRLRSEPEARQEHLHLLGGRVLRFVEDHERVVQRPAAHERDRRDLDHAALEQALDALGVEHVVERVVQRPQVRIDLLLQIARQEAELLAGLDRRPRQDDARRRASTSRYATACAIARYVLPVPAGPTPNTMSC